MKHKTYAKINHLYKDNKKRESRTRKIIYDSSRTEYDDLFGFLFFFT